MRKINTYILEKLRINKNSKVSDNDKLDEIAFDIISNYFGGYMPKSLSDEGMKCTYTQELYSLVEKMENLYCDDNPSWNTNDKDVNYIHRKVTELVRKINK